MYKFKKLNPTDGFDFNNLDNARQNNYAWSIAEFITNGNRRPKTNAISSKQYEIIKQSWCQHPRDRLTMNDIVALLETELIKFKHN